MRGRTPSWRATCALLMMLATVVACGPQPEPVQVEPVVWPVLLVRFGPDLAVPLGCYDAELGALTGGRTCALRVPTGDAVSVASDAGFEVVAPAQAMCASRSGGRNAVQLRRTDGKPMASVESGVPVVWPADAERRVLERVAMPEAPVEVDAALHEQLAGLVVALGGADDWFVRQVVEVDLDGDGTADRLIALAAGEPRAETFGALVVAYGQGAPAVVHDSRKAWFGIEATTDLDANGKREVWFHVRAGDSQDHVLTWLEGSQAREVGAWGCE